MIENAGAPRIARERLRFSGARKFVVRLCFFPAVLGWALGLATASPAADNNALPVPSITIYPGDTIKDNAIVDRDFSANSPSRDLVIDSRSALVGKIARRTLLPGLPIPINAVSEPRAIANGAKVRVVYQQEGLVIETYASALQAGSVGEVISVRNLDSGLTISGIVQSDGSVRVGG